MLVLLEFGVFAFVADTGVLLFLLTAAAFSPDAGVDLPLPVEDKRFPVDPSAGDLLALPQPYDTDDFRFCQNAAFS